MSTDWKEWLEARDEGTTAVDLAFLALEESFVAGDPSERRIIVRYYQRDVDGSLVGKAVFGPGAQGPPDHAHGGSMAALLDDAMGGACWLNGHPVLVANLNITYRRMLPLHTPCLVEARVDQVEGRKIRTRGRIVSLTQQEVFTEGEALFVKIDTTQMKAISPRVKAIIERLHRQRRD